MSEAYKESDMLRDVDVSCICTHGRCYAMLMSLALAHMVGATRCSCRLKNMKNLMYFFRPSS